MEQGLADGPWSLTDHGKKAESKLKANPCDLESWNSLVREAQVSVVMCCVGGQTHGGIGSKKPGWF